MKKKIIFTTLLIIWMMVIFMFSNATATNSQKTSDSVTKTVIKTTTKITKKKYTEKEMEKIVDNNRTLVRKTAHFTLYLVLGVLVYLTFKSYNINKRTIIYSILFCLTYALSDEIHQIFRDGRSFMVFDIGVDTLGGTVGTLVISRFIK